MSKRSIFTRQNQTLIDLFKDAGHPDKVLCIPIDYAKQTHVALYCNGSGKVLKKAVPVKNTPEGIGFLLEVADKICRKHRIERKHVFFGGEDCSIFSLNFIYGLREKGFTVIGVNAKDAADQRENLQASTDEIDLLGIAKLLINRRGSTAGGEPSAERALRTLTRHRKAQARFNPRIHAWYEKKKRKSGVPKAKKALACKLAKAVWHVMNGKDFDEKLMFG